MNTHIVIAIVFFIFGCVIGLLANRDSYAELEHHLKTAIKDKAKLKEKLRGLKNDLP